MQSQPWIRGAAALATVLLSSSIWAQGAVITAPGVDVRGSSNGTSVIVNGSVVNSAAGKGAVAETNIPGRSTRVQGSGSGGAAVVIQSSGEGSTVVHSKTSSGRSSAGGREHVNTDMSGANLVHANFGGHSFTNVDLSNANLQGANLQGAELVNVDLTGANLAGANLSGASLVNVTLDGAITTGAIWTNGRRR